MLLDIGLGIISAIAISLKLGLYPNWEFIAAGIFFSLLMDFDFLSHLAFGGSAKNAYRHRDLLHNPLMYLPLGYFIIWPISQPLAFLFFIASILHFIHDSIGLGWGVRWLYPFSKDRYSFFWVYQPPGKPGFQKRWLYVWHEKDMERLEKESGDPDWLKHIYGNWHPFALIEYLVFLSSLVVLYIFFK